MNEKNKKKLLGWKSLAIIIMLIGIFPATTMYGKMYGGYIFFFGGGMGLTLIALTTLPWDDES